ncbi:syntaxin-binding protein 4 isoform X4, partial [Tachysurus ichikawai]
MFCKNNFVFQGILEDTEDNKNSLEKDIEKSTEKSNSTVEENEVLKRLQEAEAVMDVQMQPNSAEQDYEEVIRLLEAEIKYLKEQLAEKKHTSLQVSATLNSCRNAPRRFPSASMLTVTHPIWQDRVRYIDALIDSFRENDSDPKIEARQIQARQDFQCDSYQFR